MPPDLPPLFAGMPSITLSDVARMRLEVISFFLLVFLVSAAAVRWLWNGLAKDFPRLPRLSYGRALGLVALWGAAFLLVLTMISGARELMTPGAWKKDGLTYKLNEDRPPPPEPPPAGPSEAERRQKLGELKRALWAYAETHGGELPKAADDGPAWQTPHPSGMRYGYAPGRSVGAGPRAVIAYEPELFGDTRLALFADGGIRPVTSAELADLLKAAGGGS